MRCGCILTAWLINWLIASAANAYCIYGDWTTKHGYQVTVNKVVSTPASRVHVLHDGHFCVSNRSCMMLRVSQRHATFWVTHITAWGTSEKQCATMTRIWHLLKICRTRWTWDEPTATLASHTSHLETWRQLWSARNIFLVCVLCGDWHHKQCMCLFSLFSMTLKLVLRKIRCTPSNM